MVWALLKYFIMKSCDNLSCGFDLTVCFFKWLIVCQYGATSCRMLMMICPVAIPVQQGESGVGVGGEGEGVG